MYPDWYVNEIKSKSFSTYYFLLKLLNQITHLLKLFGLLISNAQLRATYYKQRQLRVTAVRKVRGYWTKDTTPNDHYKNINYNDLENVFAFNCILILKVARQQVRQSRSKSYRLFARSGHMVWNKLCWDASCTVGLPKQSNSYQSSPTFLCF